MEDYRSLTFEEIGILERGGCQAEDWNKVLVAEGFRAEPLKNVSFYGDVRLGVFEKDLEVSKGFMKHSGIRNATLRNVIIGNDCLIENIGNFINNYTIGNECYISNVNTMETTEGATFGEGHIISVLNEVGDGNVVLFDGLTSQLAALMVKYCHDKLFMNAIKKLVRQDIVLTVPDRGTVGNHVKILNTGEITNTHINDDCEIIGACRLSDCSIKTALWVRLVRLVMVLRQRVVSSLQIRICRTARRVLLSVVRFRLPITRVRCLSAVSFHFTMPVRRPTSRTMLTKWDRYTTGHLSAVRRQPAVLIS